MDNLDEVIDIVSALQGSYSASGIKKRFRHPRPAFLDGLTPEQYIDYNGEADCT